jgi:tubulin epsilon
MKRIIFKGWKTGLCSVPPFGQAYSLLGLANNTCIKDTFSVIRERFHKLYRRKAHLHHYTQVEGMDLTLFSEAEESILALINDYGNMEKQQLGTGQDTAAKDFIERIKVLA